MNTDPEDKGQANDSTSQQVVQPNDGGPNTRSVEASVHPEPSEARLQPSSIPPRRKRKYNKKRPLEPMDEAIAEYVAMPRTLRQFKSLDEIAKHFNVCRMTVHRHRMEIHVLERIDWLQRNNKLAGDQIARSNWTQIVISQVKAARKGNVVAARLCREIAWPKDPTEKPTEDPAAQLLQLINS